MFGMVWHQGEICLKRWLRPYGKPIFMPVCVTWHSYYAVRAENPDMFAPIRTELVRAEAFQEGDYIEGVEFVSKVERTGMGVAVMTIGPKGPQGYLYDPRFEAEVAR